MNAVLILDSDKNALVPRHLLVHKQRTECSELGSASPPGEMALTGDGACCSAGFAPTISPGLFTRERQMKL